eukprot:73759_1
MARIFTLVIAYIICAVYHFKYVSAANCCQMTDLYIQTSKQKVDDVCGKYTKMTECIVSKNIGTCDWKCYLKKTKDYTEKLIIPDPSRKDPRKKEYEFSADEISKLNAIGDSAAKFYTAYSLLTYDAKGNAELYEAHPDFLKQQTIIEIIEKYYKHSEDD